MRIKKVKGRGKERKEGARKEWDSQRWRPGC